MYYETIRVFSKSLFIDVFSWPNLDEPWLLQLIKVEAKIDKYFLKSSEVYLGLSPTSMTEPFSKNN